MKIIKKFCLKIAKRELQDYTHKVSVGSIENHGVILGHACLIFAQIIKKFPIVNEIVKTQEDIYGKELSDLILQTNNLLKEYSIVDDIQNTAGVKLWNETFRCLVHPELTSYGKEIWSYFSKAQEDTRKYLNDLENKFVKEKDYNMMEKIDEAREYIYFIPSRYKE